MEKITRHYLVSGRVQGVYYRASTEKQAKALGVTGWVRNLPDGRVEVLASGSNEQLHQLQEWLWQGPVAAKIEEVIVETVAWQDLQGFVVK